MWRAPAVILPSEHGDAQLFEEAGQADQRQAFEDRWIVEPDRLEEGDAEPLDAKTPGTIQWLLTSHVFMYRCRIEGTQAHHATLDARQLAHGAGIEHAEPGQELGLAPGESKQLFAGAGFGARFAEDPAIATAELIRADHQRIRVQGGNGPGFFAAEAQHQFSW